MRVCRIVACKCWYRPQRPVKWGRTTRIALSPPMEATWKCRVKTWRPEEHKVFTVSLNCFGSILKSFFFLETISSDLWTISYLLTLDCNFLLIWANCKCFGTCVQTVSAVCTTTNCIRLVDQNRWVDSHLNWQTLHNFSIIFHRVSITFKTIHSIIKKLYTRMYIP